MGMLGNLFKTQTSMKSRENVKLPPQTEYARNSYYENNLNPALSWFSDPANTTYTGPITAGVNDNITSGWSGLLDAADVMSSAAPQMLANLGMDYLSGKYRDVSQDPTLQSAIRATFEPLDTTFATNTIPQINSSAVSQGAWGNNRVDFSQAQAARDLATVKSNTASQLAYDAAKRQEDLQLNSPELLKTAIDLASIKPQTQLDVGEQQKSYEQEQIDAQRQAFNDVIEGMLNTFQPFQGIFGEVPSVSGTTSVTHGTEKGPLIDTIMKAVMAAAAAAASDRRLKRDIRLIGHASNGLGLYIYRYVIGDKFRLGVMADEVARVCPSAVYEGPGGFMFVDGTKLADVL